MSVTGKLRGHDIYWDGEQYRYCDTDEPTIPTIATLNPRPCGHCGHMATAEGHDYCIASLPGVMNACCGHGERGESYIQFANGVTVRGFTIDEGAQNESER